ncbi:hypothetical protein DFH28DRAFT_1129041 [Melampsora americana]|nr:hypothetical protein DFH28DRAFT_1129041 [Melampsora americana]
MSSPLTNLSEEPVQSISINPLPFSPSPHHQNQNQNQNHNPNQTSPQTFAPAPTPLANFDPPTHHTSPTLEEHHHHFNSNSNQETPLKDHSFSIPNPSKVDNQCEKDDKKLNEQDETIQTDQPTKPNPSINTALSSFKIKRNSITKKSNSNPNLKSNQKKSKSSNSDSIHLTTDEIQSQSPSQEILNKSEKKRKSTNSKDSNPSTFSELSLPQSKSINSNKKINHSTPTPTTTTTTKRPNKSIHHSSQTNLSNKKPKLGTNHSSNPTSNSNPIKTSNKTGEFDLNDPNCWGALFGGSEKKVIEKPNKPIGNIPRTTTFVGTSTERLANRTKQRIEQKRLLNEQNQTGFDLMQQATEMMNFEIDYKILVRDMASKPLPNGTMIENPETHSSSTPPVVPSDPIPYNPPGPSVPPTSSVILRPGGYKRYTLPPPPPPPPPPSTTTPINGSQSNGMMYSSTSLPAERRRILPRPSLFSSSFFIWQKINLT